MTTQEIIISIIEAVNMNPRSFAMSINQPYSRIYDLFAGRTKNISRPIADSIVEKYNVDRTYLANGTGPMFVASETQARPDDPVVDSFLNVIAQLSNELTKEKERSKKLGDLLGFIATKYPDVAELLSDQPQNNPSSIENQRDNEDIA